MNKRLKLILSTFLFYSICCCTILKAQVTLECNDALTITTLTHEDIVIPETNQLTIYVRGGDGGDVDFGNFCNTYVKGGAGASIEATFEVGDSENMLKPGGLLRVFVGRAGQKRDVLCSNGGRVSGAGGGSSAVLYLPPNADASVTSWIALAVAGAGGGAARPVANSFQKGQGGRSSEAGGNSGNNQGGNDSNGGCPDPPFLITPPGIGDGVFCEAANTEDGQGMVELFNNSQIFWRLRLKANSFISQTGGDTNRRPDGGDGFNGGGAAGEGGGGGGGWNGGGAKGGLGGGGGGSYVLDSHFGASSISIQGGTTGGGSLSAGLVTITTAGEEARALCNPNVVVELDANGQGTLQLSDVDNGSQLSECDDNSRLVLTAAGTALPESLPLDCGSPREAQIQLAILDAQDNILDFCTSTISVLDNIAPIVEGIYWGRPNAHLLNLNVYAYDYELPPESLFSITDACEVEVVEASINGIPISKQDDKFQYEFDCSHIGINEASVTVEDLAGNRTTATLEVEVLDIAGPYIYRENITLTLDESYQITITPDDVMTTAPEDNCSVQAVSVFPNTFDCSNAGDNEVTITATDPTGNIRTETATVSIVVEDVTSPTALCKNTTIQLGTDGTASLSVDAIDAGSTDNCQLISRDLDQTSFNSTHVGTNTVTLTVRDNNNNSSTCTATVTVEGSFTNPILPILESVVFDPQQGKYVACFGYQNDNTGNIEIPIGDNNEISDGPDRGQPGVFLPGLQSNVFCIALENEEVASWVLIGPDGVRRRIRARAPSNDIDFDGVIDSEDNCPSTYNPDQTDGNGNNVGDACQTGFPMTIRLIDSQGNPLEGGIVEYQANSWNAFGTTDANGEAQFNLARGVYNFRMTYEGYTVEKNRINTNATDQLDFQTMKMEVDFIDSEGNPHNEGEVNFSASGWKDFGDIINGRASKELLPGRYSFNLKYAGKKEQQLNINILTTNPLVFQTVKMEVTFTDAQGTTYDEGEVSYRAGDWKVFGTISGGRASRELLPNTYDFRLSYGGYTQTKQAVDISTINPLQYETLPVVVRLEDENQNGISGGVVSYNGSDDSWYSFGTTQTDGNTPSMELLAGVYSFRMDYGGQTDELSVVDLMSENPVLFSRNTNTGLSFPQTLSYKDTDRSDYGVDMELYPNPFRSELTIEYISRQTGQVSIDIYDMKGQRINNLYQAQVNRGAHLIERWDGSDSRGMPLPSGMYLIQLRNGVEVINKKVMLQRD